MHQKQLGPLSAARPLQPVPNHTPTACVGTSSTCFVFFWSKNAGAVSGESLHLQETEPAWIRPSGLLSSDLGQ